MIYRFDGGERVNEPVFNKVILFSNVYFVMDFIMAITSIYLSCMNLGHSSMDSPLRTRQDGS